MLEDSIYQRENIQKECSNQILKPQQSIMCFFLHGIGLGSVACVSARN